MKMIIGIVCVVLMTVLVIALVVIIVNTKKNKASLNETLEYISTIGGIDTPNGIEIIEDSDGYYSIITDRNLKIVQITDIHIGGGWLSKKFDLMAINAIASMIKEEKPDLVIATGDISYPSSEKSGTINNQYAARIFASLMNELNVYWVPTFGNHDSESHCLCNREQMGEFYSSDEWTKCLFQVGDENIKGYGNSVIKVKNSDGIITQGIFTIDSNDYHEKGGYANIHQTQIDWYKKTCESLGNVKSLVFMHIPPVEYEIAWNEFKENGYRDTENVKYFYGTLGEKVCPPKEDDLFFETVLETNSTQGIFVGHDHVNIFSLEYKGVRLTYGMSIDYNAYSGISKKGTQRGCTVITIKPNGTFDCYNENYYQDKYVNPDKEKVIMQQLNEEFN